MTDVNDRPAERGIALNNVLTGAVLAAILWVGNSIMDIRDNLASLYTTAQLNAQAINYLKMQAHTHREAQTNGTP